MKSDYPYLGQGRIKKYQNLENHSFDHNGPDNGIYTFKDFMRAVDQGCQDQIGCSAHDLSDYPYHDDWEIFKEDLAILAPEDYTQRIQVFSNQVGYTVDEVKNENSLDQYPFV